MDVITKIADPLSLLLGQPCRHILFDLDGTLIDSVPDLTWAVDQMLTQQKLLPVGEALVRTWVGNGAMMLVRRALKYRLGREPDPQQKAVALSQFMDVYQAQPALHTRLYGGVLDALQVWHSAGMRMAIITNKPERFIAPILDALSISHYFECCLGGDSLDKKKPAPEPLWVAMKALHADCTSTVMIGDSVNDVQAARAANVKVACVSYGYNHGGAVVDTKPNLVVDTLVDLL